MSGDIQHVLLQKNVITTQAAIVRRDYLMEAGGFDERLPCLVDWELWLRLAADYHFCFLAEPSVTVHFTPQSVSVRETAVADALSYILQKHAGMFELYPDLFAFHQYQIGHLRFISGNKKEGMVHLKTTVQFAPRNPRYRLALGIAHFGVRVYHQIYRWKMVVAPEWY